MSHDAVRIRKDRRLTTGRQSRVNRLQTRIRMICHRHGEVPDDTEVVDDAKFVRLQNELVNHDRVEIRRCFLVGQAFQQPPVESITSGLNDLSRSLSEKCEATEKTEETENLFSVVSVPFCSFSGGGRVTLFLKWTDTIGIP